MCRSVIQCRLLKCVQYINTLSVMLTAIGYLFCSLNYRHVIAAPSSVNSYAGGTFPGVTDAIFNAKTSQNWDEVHRQIDIVAVHIMYATQIMEQPGLEWL